MKKQAILILSVLLFLSSCSVQKRYYEKGYTITWHHHTKEDASVIEVTRDEAEQILVASADSSIILPAVLPSVFSASLKDSCDKLEFRNSTILEAKVLEIGPSTIKYKRCDNPNGPDYTIDKNDVDAIVYSNGEREIIKSTTPPAPHAVELKESATPAAKRVRDDSLIAWRFGSLSLIPFAGLIFSILGLVFGIISFAKMKKHQLDDADAFHRYKWRTAAALIMSFIGLLVGVSAILFLALLFGALSSID